MEIGREKAILWTKKIIICFISIIALGVSIGINISAALGADPISVLFDGSSNITGMELGLITNIINITLTIIVLFVDRKYINIGTLIYVLSLGMSIEWGTAIYDLLVPTDNFVGKLIISLIGCLLAFVALGAYVAINIGVDAWSAIALIISKRTGKQYRTIRMLFDFVCMILGYFLGGTVGIVTIFSAFAGGPLIQKATEILDKMFTKVLQSKKA